MPKPGLKLERVRPSIQIMLEKHRVNEWKDIRMLLSELANY